MFRVFATLVLVVMATTSLSAGDQPPDDALEAAEEAAFKAAAAAVAPAVLRIETFGGAEKVGGLLVGTGPTTGLAISEDGYILSSAFNFAQNPSSILVTLPSGKRSAAKIIARDHSRLLVLLKVVSDEKLTVPEFASREEVAVGDWAIAVGRTFEQSGPNISVGIISAKRRIWGKSLQTDAKISPANYGGPLVDLRGRVLGILAPLSPDGPSLVSGAQWYDSGIGFAVPVTDILPRLDALKAGEDQRAGLLGVSLKPGDLNSAPPVIIACPPKGPAAKAGLLPLDKIVAVDGVPIVRGGELKHALGPKYAGETVRLDVIRGEKQLEVTVELVGELEPYQHPQLGILPRRELAPDTVGVVIRHVFPSSPAAQAGLQAGDRITKLGDTTIATVADLAERLAAFEPGEKVALAYRRGDAELTAEVTLVPLASSVAGELPPAHEEPAPASDAPPVGVIDVQVPEEKHKCVAYVPTNYHPAVPHGLLIVLHVPGQFEKDQLVARYRALCDEHEMILVLPQAGDARAWDAADAAFIRKAITDLSGRYRIDRLRVAAHGYRAGGTMAWMLALTQSDVIRAVAAVEAPFPQRALAPEVDPAVRRWYYSAASAASPDRTAIAAGLKRLGEQKQPVLTVDTGPTVRDLNAAELEGLGRWFDSLDRL